MIQKNKCLIIGGSGFIGSHLSRKLLYQNYSVTVFSLGNPQNNKNLKEILHKIEYIEGNINDIDLLTNIITPDSIVFDLATTSVPSTSAKQVLTEIQSHVNLIEISCIKKARRGATGLNLLSVYG